MANEESKKGVLVKLTQEQYDEFKKICSERGLTMAAFTRQMIFQAMKEEKELNKKGETHNDK